MNFLRRFRQAWREAALMAQYDFTQGGDWTDDDALRLAALFESNTGLRLKARLINFRARCAIEASRQPTSTKFHCGIAHGVAMTIAELENSFARPLRSEVTSEDEPSSVVHSFGIT